MREKDAIHSLENPRVEELIDELFQRRVNGVQALYVGSAREVIRDLVQIFDFYFCVPMLVRIQHDIGPFLAGAKTHVRLYFHVGKALCSDALFELRHDLLGTARLAIDILTNETGSAHKISPES
jgi:hypothetical protein